MRPAILKCVRLASAEHFAASAKGVAVVAPTGVVAAVNRSGERLLAVHLGETSSRLPADLLALLRHERATRNGDAHREASLALRGEHGALVIHCLPLPGESSSDLLILEEPEARLSARALGERGLTPREIEVLDLVAQGQADKQCALALGVSVRTVQKHLERIYRKLDAPNRTAALARAYGLSSPPSTALVRQATA